MILDFDRVGMDGGGWGGERAELERQAQAAVRNALRQGYGDGVVDEARLQDGRMANAVRVAQRAILEEADGVKEYCRDPQCPAWDEWLTRKRQELA